MGKYNVTISRQPEKFLEKIDAKTHERILELLKVLEDEPVPVGSYDVEKIIGAEADYRIRIGWYRIQYTVYWTEKIINVFDIDRKKDRSYK